MELGKSEALLKGENATLRHDLAVVENLNEKLVEDVKYLTRKLNYSNRVRVDSMSRVSALEADKKVLVISMVVFVLVVNVITFMVGY